MKILRSLRFRIFVIICLVGILPSILLRYTFLKNYEDRAVAVRIADVQSQCQIIANHLSTYQYLNDTSSDVVNAELEQLSNLYDGRVIVVNSDLKIVKDTYSISQGKTMISDEVVKCFRKETTVQYDPVNYFIEITTPISPAGSDEIEGVMLTSISANYILETMERLGNRAFLIIAITSVLIVVLAFFGSLLIVRPFRRVVREMDDIKEGFVKDSIYVPDFIETEALSLSVNQMIGRMEALDASRQEFVSNVSHELKTPITSIKVLADSLVQQGDQVPVELYREFMEDIVQEIDRETGIINDLLTLVKTEGNAKDELNISSVDVGDMVEKIMKRLTPIAQKAKVELVMELVRPIVADVDETKFTLAITNLIENGIKYNDEGGTVTARIDADYQAFTIEVSDNGMGIPEEALAHVFERFYRVDKSHSSEIGGTGLGLAITKSIVLMHHGAIKVDSTEGEGTTFTVRIPRTYLENGPQYEPQPAQATTAPAEEMPAQQEIAVEETETGEELADV